MITLVACVLASLASQRIDVAELRTRGLVVLGAVLALGFVA